MPFDKHIKLFASPVTIFVSFLEKYTSIFRGIFALAVKCFFEEGHNILRENEAKTAKKSSYIVRFLWTEKNIFQSSAAMIFLKVFFRPSFQLSAIFAAAPRPHFFSLAYSEP